MEIKLFLKIDGIVHELEGFDEITVSTDRKYGDVTIVSGGTPSDAITLRTVVPKDGTKR